MNYKEERYQAKNFSGPSDAALVEKKKKTLLTHRVKRPNISDRVK